MKLFLVLSAVLFISCSPEPAQKHDNESNKKDKKTRTTKTTNEDLKPTRPAGIVSATEDMDLAIENIMEPAQDLSEEEDISEQEEVVSLEEEIFVVPQVPDPIEDIVPLDLTEDQLLVAQINNKYNHYLDLVSKWNIWEENHGSQLDQATNQKFLNTVHVVQRMKKENPITSAQIEDIEASLTESTFPNEKERKYAEKTYEGLSVFSNVFEAAINLVLEYVEQAKTYPSILYTEKEVSSEQQMPEPEETPVEATETAMITTPQTTNSTENTVVDTAIPPSDTTQENIDTPVATTTPQITNNTENTATTTIPMLIPPSENTAVEDVHEGTADETAEDSSKEINPIEEESVISEAEKPNDAEELEEMAETADDEETSFMDNISARWNNLVQWFDETFSFKNPGQWVASPTTLNTSNTDDSAEDETAGEETATEKITDQTKNHQLIDELIQNVHWFAQTYNVTSVEELIPHLTKVSNTPEEENEDLSMLFNNINQIAQSVKETANGNAADFVESSGYSSTTLSKEEIIRIVEMLLSHFVDKDQQEPTEEEVEKTDVEELSS